MTPKYLLKMEEHVDEQNPQNTILKYCHFQKDKGKEIREKLSRNTLLIASDGSYKTEEAAYGYCLNQKNDLSSMYGGGKCDGVP